MLLIIVILSACQKQKKYDAMNNIKKIVKTSDRKYFGDYGKPELLQQLENYNKISGGNLILGLSCYLSYESRYSNTPIDVIPFAATGSDGVHFGFLTDFGTVKDLNNAPIVCISPLGGPPVQIVAKNLKDFFALVISVREIDDIEDRGEHEENDERDELEDACLEMPQVYKEVDIEKWTHMNYESIESEIIMKQLMINRKLKRMDAVKMFEEKYQIIPIRDVVQYIKDVDKKRQLEITIQTNDGIGVVYPFGKSFLKVFDYKIKDVQIIKEYLLRASKEERIKFYRDATYEYVLSKDYDYEIKKLIIEMLKKDKFYLEAKLLNEGL